MWTKKTSPLTQIPSPNGLGDRVRPDGSIREYGFFDSLQPPGDGLVLIVRRPYQQCFTVVYPDGQSEPVHSDRRLELFAKMRGIPLQKLERAMNYAMNFGAAYVDAGSSIVPPK
jgi:hypothetical protein